MKQESLEKLYQTAKKALLEGGDILRRGFTQKKQVSFKSIISPVTQVDRRAEKKIISLIQKKFPTHTFLAEESLNLLTTFAARVLPRIQNS